ncbi:hypothetical protein [Nocardia sp. XZ_19_231]|nr:hypothetical protein [Nocardia sp. XZ_19_231]
MPAPPTVQVTIGRIDVRATQPPAARPHVERATAKPTSLDDYLAQRNHRG